MVKSRFARFLAPLLALALIAALAPLAPPAAAAETFTLIAGGFDEQAGVSVNNFNPEEVTINVGDTVTWQILGFHNVGFPANGGSPAPLIVPDPANPQGLIWAYDKLSGQLDPGHPMVIVQAPVGTQAGAAKYRPAFDVTGVDVFPISYAAEHSPLAKNGNLKAVGTLTRRMVAAASGGTRPASAWTTLQIAWNGTVMANADNRRHTIRCFPSLDDLPDA